MCMCVSVVGCTDTDTLSVSYNIGIGLFIVRYKLKDFKCDYGANFLDKLCYAVSNGFYEWCIIANHPCR